jgi:hypothetical protein
MKKTAIGIAIAACATPVLAADILHGSLSGMSGAGYATADFSEGVLLNPSQLASRAPEKGGFALLLNLGAFASDADELQTQAEDLTDLTDSIKSSTVLTNTQAQELKGRLQSLNGDSAHISGGGNLVIALANKEYVSVALVANSSMQLSLTPTVKNSDMALIDSYINKSFDPSSETTGLDSSVYGKGAVVSEVGIALAKSFKIGEKNKLQIGITPKKIKVESIVYDASVANYDEDDWDGDKYTVSHNGTDIDLGALYVMDNYRFGAVIKNAKGGTYSTIDPNEKIEIKRQLTASAGYVKGKLTTEVALDLNAVPSIGLQGDTQHLRVGVDFAVLKYLHLRGGLQQDTKNTAEDTYSLGLGAGPFSLAYITGNNRTEGVVIGGGIRF